MTSLMLRDIEKIYPNGTRALKGINLDIRDGEFMVFVGPSGCGKSTLLRMVAGLETVTAGEMLLDAQDLTKLSPADRDVAMVFQNYALYPHMNVKSNISYALKNRNVPSDEIDLRVAQASEMLNISEYLDRKPSQLSGGQKQRVAMGRAIVRKPKIFLFDEPLSNLDALLRTRMRVEIRMLQRQLGITSIFVTHDQIEAMTIGDRLAVMNNGIIEQVGAPMEIYSQPASAFVASFIGSPSINWVKCDMLNGVVSLFGQSFSGFKSVPDGPVTVGVRPEDVQCTKQGEGEITVTLTESLGAEDIIYGTRPSGEEIRLRQRVIRPVEIGTRIAVKFAKSKLHIFGGDGRRVN